MACVEMVSQVVITIGQRDSESAIIGHRDSKGVSSGHGAVRVSEYWTEEQQG